MRDDQLRGVLHGLGIDDDTLPALSLLPLVQVAWADGRIQDRERKLILDAAAERGVLGPESLLLLESWLRFKPSARYLARGRQALVELAHRAQVQGGPLAPGTIEDVVELSRQVARAAGGLLGLGAVDTAEQAELAFLASQLDEDRTRNWHELFDTLQDPPPLGATATAAEETVDDEITQVGELAPLAAALQRPDDTRAGTSAGAARVVILGTEDQPDEIVALDQPPVSAGRRTDHGICLRWDPLASRTHCIFRRQGDRWYVVDAHSVNGTRVNGELVLERRLFGDELIKVGDTVLRFERVA